MIINKIKLKLIVLFCVLFTLFNVNLSSADSNNIKEEFVNTIKKYNIDDIIVKHGVMLVVGESMPLSQTTNIAFSNDNTVKIGKDGKIEAMNPGTVFLSQKNDDKIYITEIYVIDENTQNQLSKISPYSQKSSTYKVFIDPGHGGSDPGAVYYGYEEADINLKISNLVKDKLENIGVDTMMSRYNDTYLSLSDRSTLSNNYNPHVFLSIHQNAFTDASVNGIETYYHTNKAWQKPLSDVIQANLINYTGARNRGVKHANFAVLRLTQATSSLIECGFISNKTECDKLISASYQNKIANAIVDGVVEHLGISIGFSDIGGHWAEKEIKDFVSKGYIRGYEDGTFRPNNSITRAEFVKIVNSYFGYTDVGHTTFKDLSTSHWGYTDIMIGVKAGYIIGYSDNTFRPNSPITREEVAKIVSTIKNLKGDGIVEFKDKHLMDAWSLPHIDAVSDNNIMYGKGDNLFAPKDYITRAEVVVTLGRIN